MLLGADMVSVCLLFAVGPRVDLYAAYSRGVHPTLIAACCSRTSSTLNLLTFHVLWRSDHRNKQVLRFIDSSV